MDGLLWLRAGTVRLRQLPGTVLLLEPLRRWFSRSPASRVITDFDGTRLEVRLHEHMGSHLFWYGSYSREVLRVVDRILRPGMVMLDVGANIGEVTLFSAKRVGPNGRVYAFEPMPALAGQLRANIERNQAGNVELIEAAVSDTAGTAMMYAQSQLFHDGTTHEGLATLFGQGDRRSPVGTMRVTTLDEEFAALALPSLDLIKIDIEGAELPALRGAIRLLQRWRPWLIIEVQTETSVAAGYQAADILQDLEQFGYRFARIGRRGTLVLTTATSLIDFQNILAIPEGRPLPTAS
jgi:FkbM family methyltransferase